MEVDLDGCLWFTTDHGVVKYNSYAFENYEKGDLQFKTNFQIFKLNQNQLWFSGYDGSISCLENNRFHNTSFNKELIKINNSWVKGLHQVSQDTFRFFLKSNRKSSQLFSYYIFNRATQKITKYEISEEERYTYFEGRNADNFFYDSKLNLISEHLIKYDDKKYLCAINKDDVPRSVRDLNYSTLYLTNNKIAIDSLSLELSIRKISKDNNNNTFYILTNKGLFLLNIENDRLLITKHILNEYSFSNIYQTDDNNIWLTTTNSGIIYIPNININRYLINPAQGDVFQTLENLNNHLLIGNQSGKILAIDESNNITELDVKKINGYRQFYKKNENEILLSDNTKLKIDKGKVHITSPEHSHYPQHGIILKNKNYILGSYHFIVLNTLDSILFTSKKIFDKTDLRITKIFEGEDNILFVGSLSGLIRIDNFNFNESKHLGQIIPKLNSRVTDIQANKADHYWISNYDHGLVNYNARSNQVIEYKKNQKPDFPIIHNLFQENDSIIWMATNNGICRMNYVRGDSIEVKDFKLINSQDGLFSNFIIDITKWNNRIWFTDPKGLSFFYESDLVFNNSPPKIQIDNVKLNGEEHTVDYLVNPLKHYQNNIAFNFTGISYHQPQRSQFYKYCLKKNRNKCDWQYTDSREIQFTNLEDGNYEFIVMAQNKNNIWSIDPAIVTFKIEQKFTNTFLFKTLLFSGLLLILYFINKKREQIIIEREANKRLINQTKLRAQKAEIDALRGQMNPHFVFNAMNSIQNFIFKNEHEKANFYLSKMSQLMRSSLEMSKLKYVKIAEVHKFLKTYLDLEVMRFSNLFDYTITIDSDINHNSKIPPLMIQPFVENAIKHGFKNLVMDGSIKINFSKKEDLILISIEDNGCGIGNNLKSPSLSSHNSLSIKIIQERIDLLRTEHPNSSIRLRIKDLSNTNGKSGTQINLYLPLIK